MVLDPRKKQKKQERRAAKVKAKHRVLAGRSSQDLAARFAAAAQAPILDAATSATLWEQGIGYVLLSRELNSGSVAYVSFLVDVFCLGVKDVMFNICPRVIYDENIVNALFRREGRKSLRPECARKLVEGAVEYARSLDLPAHRDYRKAAAIFGDIDPTACREQYTFGKDGRPFFVAGPYDDRERCRQIVSTLASSVGPDGFHYLIPFLIDELLPGKLLE